jgi:uncharacterized protein YdaU (DUF1376 family)
MDKVPNDFILPFHHKEFSTSTQDWTDEEVGSYVRLLLHQWANGSITDDLTRLQRISNSIEKNAGVVLQKFKPCEEPGRLQNSKMEAIRAEKIEYYEKKRAAGKKGMESRYQTPNTTTNKPSNKNITKEGVGEGVDIELIEVIKKERQKIPPDFAEVKLHFEFFRPLHWSLDYMDKEVSAWFDFYSANGWKVGKNKMKDWKAAIRTWIRNDYNFKNKPQSNNGKRLDKNGETIISGRVTEEGAARTLAGLLLHEQRKKDAAGDFVG